MHGPRALRPRGWVGGRLEQRDQHLHMDVQVGRGSERVQEPNCYGLDCICIVIPMELQRTNVAAD